MLFLIVVHVCSRQRRTSAVTSSDMKGSLKTNQSRRRDSYPLSPAMLEANIRDSYRTSCPVHAPSVVLYELRHGSLL